MDVKGKVERLKRPWFFVCLFVFFALVFFWRMVTYAWFGIEHSKNVAVPFLWKNKKTHNFCFDGRELTGWTGCFESSLCVKNRNWLANLTFFIFFRWVGKPPPTRQTTFSHFPNFVGGYQYGHSAYKVSPLSDYEVAGSCPLSYHRFTKHFRYLKWRYSPI